MSDPSPTTGVRPAAPPYEPVVRLTPAQAATSPRPPHPILLPEPDQEDELESPAAPSAAQPRITPRAGPKSRWYVALARPAAYILSGVTGAVIVAALFGLFRSRNDVAGGRAAGGAAGGAGAAPVDIGSLDRHADSLALAIEAFTLRAKMYDSRRMGCSGLSRGLQQVEDGWLAYNVARKETMSVTDSARDARDRSLYADVRGVELRFERSPCPRP